MYTNGHFERGLILDDFISHWEFASKATRQEITKQMQNRDFKKEINACAYSILNHTRYLSNEAHIWDHMRIFESQTDKLNQIYQNLSGLSKGALKLQVNEFKALSTMIKCSQAYLKLQKIKEGVIEGIDPTQINSLFSVFKEAMRWMDNVLPNNESSVYPEIRQILAEANVNSLLDAGSDEVENAITASYFALLELPEELRSHPAFHIRAYFEAIDKIIEQMKAQRESFSIVTFNHLMRQYLRAYTNGILWRSGIEVGGYILRKSSMDNYYKEENGQQTLKYVSIAVDMNAGEKNGHDDIQSRLVYFDTQTKEWIGMNQEVHSTADLDQLSGDNRKPSLELLMKDTIFASPVSDKKPSKIKSTFGGYRSLKEAKNKDNK